MFDLFAFFDYFFIPSNFYVLINLVLVQCKNILYFTLKQVDCDVYCKILVPSHSHFRDLKVIKLVLLWIGTFFFNCKLITGIFSQ